MIAALARQQGFARDGDGRWQLRPGPDRARAATIVAAALGQAAENRLAGLPPGSREMLGLLAALGRPAAPPLLAAAAGADLRTVLDTLEGLGSAGLAVPGTHGWALTHELFRETITAAMCPAETARCHAMLGSVLRRGGPDPAEAAAHLAAGGDSDGAAAAYAAAARRQLEQVGDREAARLAEAGLSLSPPAGTRAVLLEVRGEARLAPRRAHLGAR